MAKLTPQACKAARALLDWGVRDLAKAAKIGVVSVVRCEAGATLRTETIEKIVAAFEANDVEITNGKGTGARLLKGNR
ncbi:hypothetical protein U91I_02751 [alpha proteobacterium U9-1i]|nr:hypothetical protein U91I_02751 [alpha proteobacterium U9-1i]